MGSKASDIERLSPWWRNSVIIVMIVGFSILIGLTVRAYHDAPPIPGQVVGPVVIAIGLTYWFMKKKPAR